MTAAQQTASSRLAPYAGRARLEVKQFFRQRDAVIFTFGLPILIYALYGVTMTGTLTLGGQTVDHDTYMLPGLAAAAILLTSFQATTLSVAADRATGGLKRLQTTPMPASAFVAGKVALVLVSSLAQIVLLLLTARIFFDVAGPLSWGRFAAIYFLGCSAGTTCGVAIGWALPNPKGATTVVPALTLAMQFICGVFFIFSALPTWLQLLAQTLPLTWLARGMRAAFLPEPLAAAERGGSWEFPLTMLILAAWAVAGGLLAMRSARWRYV
ncbi:ABC transporter permease [Nakamurella sp. A5-74]|uniref:Transport permease protein n=1 Tax=Nakamurella sp. A5-74 TaxID=3158264 RepID=A0AAU8DUA8_9ACTN